MPILLARLLDLILPRFCLGCRRAGDYLCDECLGSLPPAPVEPIITAAFDYHHPVTKRAIWLLKYRGGKQLAAKFARALYPHLVEALAEASLIEGLPWLLVPVPLAPQRARRRGFNQAALIAESLAARDPKHLELAPELLVKARETPPQASLRRREARLANLRGAFRVAYPTRVRGRSIIVVDDVVTSGATTGEARRVLKAAGAKSVLIVAAARD